MWKMYLKQIWYLLKENKFFSMVYILGTALSITMVMLILLTYHIKAGNIGAEDKRDRIVSVIRGRVKGSRNGEYRSFLNTKMVEKWFYPLATPEARSLLCKKSSVVYNERENRYEELSTTVSDAGFWQLFSLRFISGQPFSEAEVRNKVPKVVIDATTARRLFGSTQVVGRSLNVDWMEYKVCGVVEDVPSYLNVAFSHLYYPYTTTQHVYYDWGPGTEQLGPMSYYMLLRTQEDREKVTMEMNHQVELMNGKKDSRFLLGDQPATYIERTLQMGAWDEKLENTYQRLYILIGVVALLLLVPALNLSGMMVAQMRKRVEEIGIRKAFGASIREQIKQIFCENLIQMFLGSVLGLFLSAGLFQWIRAGLLADMNGMFYGAAFESVSSISFWHLISPVTIGYVIGACLLLNIVSTLLPAWRYARMPVVDALNRRGFGTNGASGSWFTRWKADGWILSELFFSFLCLWMVVYYISSFTCKLFQERGFDIEHVYKVSYSTKTEDVASYDADSEFKDELLMLAEKLRRCSGIEAVGLIDEVCFPYTYSNSSREVYKDTLSANVCIGSMTAEAASVFRFTPTDEKISIKEEAEKKDIYLVSDPLMERLYGEGVTKGKFRWKQNRKDHETGIKITGTVARNEYYDNERKYVWKVVRDDVRYFKKINGRATLFFRVRPEADKDFINRFWKEMKGRLEVGNTMITSIVPMTEFRRQSLQMLGVDMSYTFGYFLVAFFLLCTFLCTISTFYFRTETRFSEIGLRMVLGSTRRQVRWRMIGEGLLLFAWVWIPGLFIAYYLRGVFTFVDYSVVSISEDVYFVPISIIVTLLMALLIVVGIWYPARQASRINPVEALRDE